jgi:hypothetical protein
MLATLALFVNKVYLTNIIITDDNAMADKQVISKGFRISAKADEILKEVSKRDFRDFPTVARYALLEYVQKRHPDFYNALAEDFTPR